ncbi:MAG: flagellar hook-associated protein FlgK, partial [Janthinobacterium lividum]
MASSILNIGQSALTAAQVQIATTSHNIANLSTEGYTRQIATQSAVAGQDMGYGFVGKGTQVTSVTRVYSEFLGTQVTTSLTDKSQLDSYYNQIKTIDSLLGDSTTGVSSALTSFFSTVQNLSADPTAAATRQSLLSSANALAASFQTTNDQLSDLRQGVNDEVTTSIQAINAYSKQIATINDAIEKQTSLGNTPNDLLDQRDLLVTKISEQVKVSVVKQGNSYNVFAGNGQPLVVGAKTYDLVPVPDPADGTRIGVGYNYNGVVSSIPDSSVVGGTLGGLLEFRTSTLDVAQNKLGQLATAIGTQFNAQNALGMTETGAMGTALFEVGSPLSTPNSNNTGTGAVTTTITDATQLTGSDYRLQYDGSAYNLTRVEDGKVTPITTFPQVVDGLTIDLTGTPATSDTFLIKPTYTGADSFKVLVTNKSDIAAAAPIITTAPTTNAGSATISAGTVSTGFALTSVTPAVTLAYNSTTNTLSGFPATAAVTVTKNGVSTPFAAGAAVTYQSGATISFSNISITLTGTPANGDTFKIASNTANSGDGRNALILAGLQTAKTMDSGTNSFSSSYAALVSSIGNKTRELETTSAAADVVYKAAVTAQQSESGVNL